MSVRAKYQQIIDEATKAGITDLQVKEQENILYIEGTAPTGEVKDRLWDVYNTIDPDYRSGDLVLNVNASMVAGTKAKVITQSSNLNIRKGPGTDQEIVGKAAHNEIVTIISKANDQWSLIRTDDGEEGYAYSQYLSPE